MNHQHLVHLNAVDTVFSPDWGLSCISSVYDHILYGPETLVTRSNALTAVRSARFQLLATLPRSVRDANKEK